jgi:hypothetical protein
MVLLAVQLLGPHPVRELVNLGSQPYAVRQDLRAIGGAEEISHQGSSAAASAMRMGAFPITWRSQAAG